MHIETYKVVSFHEFLNEIGADSDLVMETVNHSNVSFGNNPDTLLDANAVEEFIAPWLLS